MRLRPRHLILPWFALSMLGCPEERSSATQPDAASAPDPTPRASNTSKVREPGPAFQRFAMPGVQGLIVGEAEAGRFYAAITGGSASYWTPEKGQIIDLETRLGAYVRRKAPPGSGPRKNLRSYRRQYLGIERNGQRFVFINFFCETHRTDWTRKPIAVDDGGDCYFQVEFDPEKHTFSNLVIHKGS